MIALVGLAMIACAFLVVLPMMAAFEAVNAFGPASVCAIGMAAMLIGGFGLIAVAIARHLASAV